MPSRFAKGAKVQVFNPDDEVWFNAIVVEAKPKGWLVNYVGWPDQFETVGDDRIRAPVAKKATKKTATKKTATKKTAPANPTRTVGQATAYKGDVPALATRLLAAVDALRSLGCEVDAKVGKRARAADLRALAKVFPEGTPASLLELLGRVDGFDLGWRDGEADVVCEWMGAAAIVEAWRAEQALLATLEEDDLDENIAARREIVPLVAQHDGCLVGVDTAGAANGDAPVVFLDRHNPPVRLAPNVGTFLEVLIANGFTHPKIPDVAHKRAAATAKKVVRELDRGARRR